MHTFINHTIIWYFGCCTGSFLMIIGTRIPLKESIITPRSHCSSCKKQLYLWQLLPVFSYFLSQGRCIFCSTKFSPLYPLMEIFTGFGYLISYLCFRHQNLSFSIALLLITFATIFIVSDCFYYILPNSLMLLFFLVSFFMRLGEFQTAFMGGTTLAFLLFFIALLVPEGMGGGDIKLAGIIGWLLGFQLGLLALMAACLLAFSYFFLLFIWKKDTKTTSIPFAPFIFFGTICVYFFNFWLI
ncbi:prepilin peptidase [Carnobacterium gallinarum]|uniref:prepilin peptidase n=1 Tax=Carnobacterium gallinarum TaxID=2749 RepID=UPI00055936A0|nr:A24 family peptidase [Carnobacterium gallinarum]